MKLCSHLFICALLVTGMNAQNRAEKRWINRLKATPVSQIDATLPAEPFDDWLSKHVATEEPVYEVNDCGERSYTPQERGQQFPLCVNVTAKVGPLRRADLTFVVGTYIAPGSNHGKPQEKPATKIELSYGEVGPSDPRSKQPTMKVGRLSDLLKYAGKN
jgi:hypothetical protein